MKTNKHSWLLMFLLLLLITLTACQSGNRVSTAEDRAALFDWIIEKTAQREAFSPIKNQRLSFDPLENMKRYREEMIEADTDEKLFAVLMKISNARKDRHLQISLVENGLQVPKPPLKTAPIRFAVDYSTPDAYDFFVGDRAKNLADFTDRSIDIGDKLVAVNGEPINDYFWQIEPFIRYSTVNGLWWKMAEALPTQDYRIPPTLGKDNITFTLEKVNGDTFSVSLPYLDPKTMEWEGFFKFHGDPRYPGFRRVVDLPTFDLYVHAGGKPILLLDWYGFREHLVEDVDSLMRYAVQHNLLEYALIWDGTRSRGGSKGAYALQRFVSRPFKVTFGNVRISDITERFIEQKRGAYEKRRLEDSGVKETIDDGTWLMEWLETDVTQAIREGRAYSNNVPFKLAHLPKDSDGFLKPADVHFRGPFVCLLAPYGGSHLDQFAAMVKDNELGPIIGMPAGGYSNTWEWEETLVFPISKKPVVRFMWSMGHTIRPNGEILEGNPAEPDVYIPQTRENYLNYYQILLKEAMTAIQKQQEN